MHPTEAVLVGVKLAGIIADDDGVGQEAMGFDAAPASSLGGNLHRIRVDLEVSDTERFEMRTEGLLVGKHLVLVLGQAID